MDEMNQADEIETQNDARSGPRQVTTMNLAAQEQ
jgi:hypothetical protein